MKLKKGNIIRAGGIEGCIVIRHKDNWVDFVEPNRYDYEYISILETGCEYISEGSITLLDKWYENRKKYLQSKEDSKTLEEKFKDKLCLLKEWKRVGKEDYEKWVQNYENTYQIELANHSIYFCSPPIHGKYDFSLNPIDKDATVCMVAKMSEGGWYGIDLPDEYYVIDNIEEVFKFVRNYNK